MVQHRAEQQDSVSVEVDAGALDARKLAAAVTVDHAQVAERPPLGGFHIKGNFDFCKLGGLGVGRCGFGGFWRRSILGGIPRADVQLFCLREDGGEQTVELQHGFP